jgi:hypothetical protein
MPPKHAQQANRPDAGFSSDATSRPDASAASAVGLPESQKLTTDTSVIQYHLWKAHVYALVAAKEWHSPEESAPKPVAESGRDTPAYAAVAKWHVHDDSIKAVMRNSMDSPTANDVLIALRTKALHSAADIIKYLDKEYIHVDATSASATRAQWRQLHLLCAYNTPLPEGVRRRFKIGFNQKVAEIISLVPEEESQRYLLPSQEEIVDVLHAALRPAERWAPIIAERKRILAGKKAPPLDEHWDWLAVEYRKMNAIYQKDHPLGPPNSDGSSPQPAEGTMATQATTTTIPVGQPTEGLAAASEARCYTCGGQGHQAAACPTPKAPGGARGRPAPEQRRHGKAPSKRQGSASDSEGAGSAPEAPQDRRARRRGGMDQAPPRGKLKQGSARNTRPDRPMCIIHNSTTHATEECTITKAAAAKYRKGELTTGSASEGPQQRHRTFPTQRSERRSNTHRGAERRRRDNTDTGTDWEDGSMSLALDPSAFSTLAALHATPQPLTALIDGGAAWTVVPDLHLLTNVRKLEQPMSIATALEGETGTLQITHSGELTVRMRSADGRSNDFQETIPKAYYARALRHPLIAEADLLTSWRIDKTKDSLCLRTLDANRTAVARAFTHKGAKSGKTMFYCEIASPAPCTPDTLSPLSAPEHATQQAEHQQAGPQPSLTGGNVVSPNDERHGFHRERDSADSQHQPSAHPEEQDTTAQGALVHARLAHLGARAMARLFAAGAHAMCNLPAASRYYQDTCTACKVAKSARAPMNTPTRRTSGKPRSSQQQPAKALGRIRPLRILHADVHFIDQEAGKQHGGNWTAWQITTCRDTKCTFVQLLRDKGEAAQRLQQLVSQLERLTQWRVAIIKADEGGEYRTGTLSTWATANGIDIQLVPPRTQSANADAERPGRTLDGLARAMCKANGLSRRFHALAILAANHVYNRVPHNNPLGNAGYSPFEVVYEQKPDFKWLRSFGALAWRHIHADVRDGKHTGQRAQAAIMVGYSHHTRSYLVYDPQERKIFHTQDVRFDEKPGAARQHFTSGGLTEHHDFEQTSISRAAPGSATQAEQAQQTQLQRAASEPTVQPAAATSSGPSVTFRSSLKSTQAAGKQRTWEPAAQRIKDGSLKRAVRGRPPSRYWEVSDSAASTTSMEDAASHGRGSQEADDISKLPMPKRPGAKIKKKARKPPRLPKEGERHDSSDEETSNVKYALGLNLNGRGSKHSLDYQAAFNTEWDNLNACGPGGTPSYRIHKSISAAADSVRKQEGLPAHAPVTVRPMHAIYVFKRKVDPKTGANIKTTCRCAPNGRHQPRDSYTETFASVAAARTIRAIVAKACSIGIKLQHWDARKAFSHAPLPPSERVFLRPPFGLETYLKRRGMLPPTATLEGSIIELLTGWQGLRQGSALWKEIAVEALLSSGFQRQHSSDPDLFVRADGKGTTYIALIVDDMIVLEDRRGGDVMGQLAAKFKKEHNIDLTQMPEDAKVAGVELEYDFNEETGEYKCKMHMSSFIEKWLHSEQMEHCKAARTPLPTGLHLSLTHDAPQNAQERLEQQKYHGLYRSRVGDLNWLATWRPDLAFAAGFLSRFLHNPGEKMLQATRHILRYLRGTTTAGLLFTSKKTTELQTYCDADFAMCADTRRSTAGYAVLCAGAAIDFASKRMHMVTTSAQEAELVALHEGAKATIVARNLTRDLDMPQPSGTVVNEDNAQVARYASSGQPFRAGSRHVDVRYRKVCEYHQDGQLCVRWCPTSDQHADILTKNLGPLLHARHAEGLGIADLRDHRTGQ